MLPREDTYHGTDKSDQSTASQDESEDLQLTKALSESFHILRIFIIKARHMYVLPYTREAIYSSTKLKITRNMNIKSYLGSTRVLA